ncbi:MAG TPA: hypothetical protein VF551_01940 [Chthoniobacterales bacterium]
MNKTPRFALAAALVLFCGLAFAGPEVEEITEEVYPVPMDVAVRVRCVEGTIHIYATNDPELKVIAIKKAYPKARLDAIRPRVTIDGANAVIDTAFPPKAEGLSLADRSGTVDYSIYVPQSATLAQVEVATGEIIVDGFRGGGVNAKLGTGRIGARNCFTAMQLQVAEGGMTVIYGWWEKRPLSLRAEIARGDITVDVPPIADLRIDAEAADGWVRSDHAKDEEPSPNEHMMKTTMGEGGEAEITLRAARGNIRIGKSY